MSSPSRQLTKDVASEIERRRRRRRMLFLLTWLVAAILAALYLRCGSGWGIGGKGKGEDKAPGAGPGSAQTTGPKRCVVRVDAKGIRVDGKQVERAQAVAACKQTEGALVTVTGDARQGDWDELRTALEAAGVQIFTRGDR